MLPEVNISSSFSSSSLSLVSRLIPVSPTASSSDLPWFKVFYRAMDKVADLKLNFQVLHVWGDVVQ